MRPSRVHRPKSSSGSAASTIHIQKQMHMSSTKSPANVPNQYARNSVPVTVSRLRSRRARSSTIGSASRPGSRRKPATMIMHVSRSAHGASGQPNGFMNQPHEYGPFTKSVSSRKSCALYPPRAAIRFICGDVGMPPTLW